MLQPKNRILVIDDNAMDRKIVCAHLQTFNISKVEEAESGEIAAEKIINAHLLRHPFHVLILDWNMRNLNGAKLLEKLAQETRIENLKVIIMTGQSEEDTVADALKRGADDFIVKPVARATFKDKLERLLNR